MRHLLPSQFYAFLQKEIGGISDVQLLILKGHIITEYALNCYLEAISSWKTSDFFKENLSFAVKVKIAKHFGRLGSKDDNLIHELELLNSLRNDMAHSLEYDRKTLDDLFEQIERKSPGFFSQYPKDSEAFRLRLAVVWLNAAVFSAYRQIVDPDGTAKDMDEFRKRTHQDEMG
jgi:hypothetical protein